jgi:hypothetical protein
MQGTKLKLKGMFEKAMGQEPKLSTHSGLGIHSVRETLGMECSSTSGGSSSTSMREAAGIALPGADSCCPNLSVKDRVKGCVMCFAIGVGTALIGWLSFWAGHITTYAVFYTLGNIIALCGTCFLFGPRRQARQMWQPSRRYASMIYLSLMVFTLGLAFSGFGKIVVLLCCLLQWAAAVWYVASYIPFGQKIIAKLCGTAVRQIG